MQALQLFLESRLLKLRVILQSGVETATEQGSDAAVTMTDAVQVLQVQ